MKEIQILVNYANKMILDKDYNKAKKALKKAITLDPSHELAYSLLGNVCYLLNEQETALKSYLSSAHLMINKFKTILLDSFEKVIDSKYEALTDYEKSRMPNKYFILLAENPTLISEIGHAFIDPTNEINDPIINECIDIYKEALIKNTLPLNIISKFNLCLEDYENIDISHFVTIGQEYLLDNLKWDKLDETNVQIFYFK